MQLQTSLPDYWAENHQSGENEVMKDVHARMQADSRSLVPSCFCCFWCFYNGFVLKGFFFIYANLIVGGREADLGITLKMFFFGFSCITSFSSCKIQYAKRN